MENKYEEDIYEIYELKHTVARQNEKLKMLVSMINNPKCNMDLLKETLNKMIDNGLLYERIY